MYCIQGMLREGENRVQADSMLTDYRFTGQRSNSYIKVVRFLPDPFKQIPGHAPILGRRVGLHEIVRRGKGTAQPAHQALVEMGGSGKTGKALDRVGEIMDNRLNTYDRMQLPKAREIRWRNAISWVRSDLEGKLLLSP